MTSSFRNGLIAVILAVLLTGCSGGAGSPVVPGNPDAQDELSPPGLTGTSESGLSNENSHALLFYNLIYLDPYNPDGPKAEIIPLREGEIHLNILKFLEVEPCKDCFKIVGFNFPEPGILDVDIQIDHPFDDLDFSVFDVRGIMMFSGSHAFPDAGKSISDPDLGDGALLNPDGYTALYNGNTIGAPVGDLQKYFEGNFATPVIPNSDINGYKYYTTDDPANNRNAFYADSSDIQTFSIKLPTGPFVLGYAVDASWAPPISSPVDDPLMDFDLNANCWEPWKIVVTEEPIGDGLTDQGGSTKLLIDVYDWQGKDTHHEPVVECPELFNGSQTASYISSVPGHSNFEVTISNTKLAAAGEYMCLVGVEADENDPVNQPWLDLTAYEIQVLEVKEAIPSITVTYPNGGEVWEWTTVEYITWTSTNIDSNVIIEYDTDGIEPWGLIYYDYPNSGSASWLVPMYYSDTVRIRISSKQPPYVSDTSDDYFTITDIAEPYINIIHPNGGEIWQAGTKEFIHWDSDISGGYVKIEYSTTGSEPWTTIKGNAINWGDYEWSIPSTPSDTVKVKISSVDYPEIWDISDNYFTIDEAADQWINVNQPNGGEQWEIGLHKYITWDSNEIDGKVKIEYSTTGTSPWNTIDDNTTNDGWYEWIIPPEPSGTVLVKIKSVNDPGISDTSDNYFTIFSGDPCDPDLTPPYLTEITDGCENQPAGTEGFWLEVLGHDECVGFTLMDCEWRKKLSGAAWQDNWQETDPWISCACHITGLHSGTWDVQVRAKDLSDNVDPDPAECSFTVYGGGEVNEIEPNNTCPQATFLPAGSEGIGTVTYSSDQVDYWEFTLNNDYHVHVWMEITAGTDSQSRLELQDDGCENIIDDHLVYYEQYEVEGWLHAGTYKIEVSQYSNSSSYKLWVDRELLDLDETETNNAIYEADNLPLEVYREGVMVEACDEYDWWKFTITEDSYVDIWQHIIAGEDELNKITLRDSDGEYIKDKHVPILNYLEIEAWLHPGTYYLELRQAYHSCLYEVWVSQEGIDLDESEPNDNALTADPMSAGSNYTGVLIEPTNPFDFWTFTLSSPKTVTIWWHILDDSDESGKVTLRSSSENYIDSDGFPDANHYYEISDVPLSAGKYYIELEQYYHTCYYEVRVEY